MTAAAEQNDSGRRSGRALAPGPYLGFALQPVRLCFHLLNAGDDCSVSIEYLDDVAVHCPDGDLLEQTKSALSQNPVSDWANDLWKTFANWADQIAAGDVDPTSTEFSIYVTPSRSGEIVQLLHAAKTPAEAQQAIATIQKRLGELSRKPGAYKYIKRVLQLEAESLWQLIVGFRLADSHDDPIEPIRKFFRNVVSAEMVDRCCFYAIGRAKLGVETLMRDGQPGLLSVREFRKAIVAFVRKSDLGGLLSSMVAEPASTLVEQTHASSPLFVRQLALIDVSSDLQLRAVSDFLQASANKTKWAEVGHILPESLHDFDQALVRQHGLTRLDIEESEAHLQPQARGRVLLSRCLTSDLKLEGREVPSHFVPGCYHALADEMVVGWHPSFKKLLSGMEE